MGQPWMNRGAIASVVVVVVVVVVDGVIVVVVVLLYKVAPSIPDAVDL